MKRIEIDKVQPEAYTAMSGLESYLEASALPPNIRELLRLRVSQINGCVFCVNLHTRQAENCGETQQRIAELANWKTSEVYSEREKIFLAVAEALTNLGSSGLPDALYKKVSEALLPEELAQLIVLIATINAWNRIGVATSSE